MLNRAFAFVVFAAAVVALPRLAAADSIDGNWCSNDGRSFEIEGPQIVTWGGTRMSGDYERHAFRYVVPSTEKGAGAHVDMILLNEDSVQVSVEGGKPQTWVRCAKPTS